MKRIVFVIPQLGNGGGERVITILANYLAQRGYNVNIIIFSFKSDNSYISNLNDEIKIVSLDLKGRISSNPLRFLVKLIKKIKYLNPDYLFMGAGTINAILSPFLFLINNKTKTIARETNLPSLFEKNKLIKLLYRFSYKNYDGIIVQSNEMFCDLTKNFKIDEKHLNIINNPVDCNFTHSESIAFKPDFDINKVNLLTIGRLTFQKGYDELILTFSKIKEKDKYHLYIIGEGEDYEMLNGLVLKYSLENNITFLGRVNNPYPYYLYCDFYISSSRWEGFPNAVIESLSLGTPVIANNYPGGINSIINANNGKIIDIKNSNEFEAVLNNTNFDNKQIAHEAFIHYDISVIAEKYLKVIEKRVR
ncbi:TPA: glycosyltransferase [Vibrio vulnificus]|nr:glycosyltransferase [Vibrio vulnificus]